jgi:hypothetical protein
MSASSARKGASSKDLPEVFVLKKEVSSMRRRVFSEACKILRVNKILKSTPAVKDRTAGFTASSVAAERALAIYNVLGNRKIAVRIKEQAPDLMKMKPEEREAAMLEYYGRMEKADLAFEKEWGGI